MAAILRAPEPVERETRASVEPVDIRHPVARLAALHAEAQETARLANLLGRSLYAAIAFPVMAALTFAFGHVGIAQSVTWAVFVQLAAGATAFVYRRTIGQPFERTALKSFSQDLSAILVFAGFAWGAGAFLALPADADIALIVAFAAGAAMTIAVLLREREAVFLFLAPVAVLTSFACVLRPLPGGALGAALVLIACVAVAAAANFAGRWNMRGRGLNELAELPFA